MSKIWNKIKQLNRGVVKTTAIVGGITGWVYGYEYLKEKKRNKIIVSKENLERAIRLKEEIGNEYINVNELAKDIETRQKEALQLKKSVDYIKNNINKD